MKDTALFINTARGDLVDENALIEAVGNRRPFKAILDVVCNEPLPSRSPLAKATNICVTPHIAGATDHVIYTGTLMTIEHIKHFLKEVRYQENV